MTGVKRCGLPIWEIHEGRGVADEVEEEDKEKRRDEREEGKRKSVVANLR